MLPGLVCRIVNMAYCLVFVIFYLNISYVKQAYMAWWKLICAYYVVYDMYGAWWFTGNLDLIDGRPRDSTL